MEKRTGSRKPLRRNDPRTRAVKTVAARRIQVLLIRKLLQDTSFTIEKIADLTGVPVGRVTALWKKLRRG